MLKPKALLKAAYQSAAAGLGYHRWSSRQARLWVLMYHRILPKSDPRYALEEPGMVVTPGTFAEQMKILPEFFEPVSLSDWHRRASRGQPLPAKACAITFDDGWQDNHQYALPILRQLSIPATVFAVASMIGTQRQFWPNRIARLLGQHFQQLHDSDSAQWLLAPMVGQSTTPGREAIAHVIDQCKTHSDDEIEARLDAIEDKLQIPPPEQADLMSWQQLSEMQASGLVEIGSHTCTHRRLLPTLPEDVLHREIVHSKAVLEDALERPVELFCYPNGDCSPLALKLVQQHYSLAVTTSSGLNDSHTAAHQLHRMGIHEDMSNSRRAFLARLSGWR